MNAKVVYNKDVLLQQLDGCTSRKVLAYNESLMLVEVHFEKGGIGTVHTHPHTQCTYVLEGSFEFTIDGEKHIVNKGDTICFQPNVPHGTLCLEKGILLDCFSPMREDFIK